MQCSVDNEYDGQIGVRVSAIFVILVGGSFGALLPIVATHSLSPIRLPDFVFFIAKYFGSGVIVATSLIHLLQPANEALTNECLGEGWQEYPYAFGICLLVIFLTFLAELVSLRYLKRMGMEHTHGPSGLTDHTLAELEGTKGPRDSGDCADNNMGTVHTHQHTHDHSSSEYSDDLENCKPATVAADLGGILILEFGIIFHSIFVGLTLAVAGEEFKMLYIVLVFHQLFEGLGLGTRLATAPWPSHKRWLPWVLAGAFGLTTPIAIAIGLGVRNAYAPGSSTALISNGIFDSISAGILLYTGLVELMANEFLHSHDFERASFSRVLSAFVVMCFGAGLMALLGRWA